MSEFIKEHIEDTTLEDQDQGLPKLEGNEKHILIQVFYFKDEKSKSQRG